MWRFGGLKAKMPLVALFMGLGALSLSGIPPFSGFYSKDAVIIATLTNPTTSGLIATLTLIAGVLSIAYIGRLWILTFSGESRDKALFVKTKKPSFFWITLPLGIMAVATFIMGFYQEGIQELVSGSVAKEEHVDGLLVGLLSAISLLALIVFYYYNKRLDLTKKIAAQPLMKSIHKILFNGYFVEFFIHYFAKEIVVKSFAKTVNWIDVHVIDAGVNASVSVAKGAKKLASKTDTGYASNNSGAMIVGVLILLVVLFIGGAM